MDRAAEGPGLAHLLGKPERARPRLTDIILERGEFMKFAIERAFLIVVSLLAAGSAQAYEIQIYNNCSLPLYIRGADQSTLLAPDNQQIPAKSATPLSYQVAPPWTSGRLYGCWDDSQASTPIVNGANALVMQQHCGLAEQTITNAAGNISSNISYVDYVAIPIQIAVPNGTACINSGSTNASFNPALVQQNCPTALINGQVCMSANQYCTDAVNGNPGSAFCSQLNTVIAQIPGAGGATTVDAYACTGFFGDPAQCAAINRGLPYTDTAQQDFQNFYRTAPYNGYSAFVHQKLGAPVLAFPYDDYPSNAPQNNVRYGEYVNCSASATFVVTFCPEPGATAYSYLGNRSEDLTPASSGLDRDVFHFRGRESTTVSVTLAALENHAGHASLRVLGQGLDKQVRGALPLQIQDLTVPSTGPYRIVVNNASPRFIRYQGPYRIALTTSNRSWKTLKAGLSVEP